MSSAPCRSVSRVVHGVVQFAAALAVGQLALSVKKTGLSPRDAPVSYETHSAGVVHDDPYGESFQLARIRRHIGVQWIHCGFGRGGSSGA
jgi:hypothetical protein